MNKANDDIKRKDAYDGFEQGPIRPPSEARSLLIRVTRNCPWNRCTFCPVYKTAKFSIRPVDHVKRDIDTVKRQIETIEKQANASGRMMRDRINEIARDIAPEESQAFSAALNWMAGGMRSVFLQDANSLVIKPAALVDILTHLRTRFPDVERITSYARSHTVARIDDDDLQAIAQAGLNRIHIGMESGSDDVLKRVDKGMTKATAIEAGLKVKRAGMELSEYIMPGLGGRRLSEIHALESADALNQIDPHFIRLRSLAIPRGVPLFASYASGEFEKCTDLEVAKEMLRFIETLDSITSTVKSDHILNLFEDLEGTLPGDKDHMVGRLRSFIEMPADRRVVYQVGRRIGVFRGLCDMDSPTRLGRAQDAIDQYGITPDNVEAMIDELMRRFI